MARISCDPTLLAFLGTLSRHNIPCHDTAAYYSLKPMSRHSGPCRERVLALSCALLHMQLACCARMRSALRATLALSCAAMCALSQLGTPCHDKNLEMGSSPSHSFLQFLFFFLLPHFVKPWKIQDFMRKGKMVISIKKPEFS